MSGILVAGIGNIFHGDDGFGVEVAQRWGRRELPPQVKVTDFGIRGLDLIYALAGNYRAVILVDAAQTGEAPGTLSIIEPEPDEDAAANPAALSGHNLDPATILRLLPLAGAGTRRVLLVACEPLDLGGEYGAIGLSAPVAAAVEPAINTIEQIVRDILAEERSDAAPHAVEIHSG